MSAARGYAPGRNEETGLVVCGGGGGAAGGGFDTRLRAATTPQAPCRQAPRRSAAAVYLRAGTDDSAGRPAARSLCIGSADRARARQSTLLEGRRGSSPAGLDGQDDGRAAD